MTGRKWEGVGGLGEVCAPSGLLPTPLALLLGALAPYSIQVENQTPSYRMGVQFT